MNRYVPGYARQLPATRFYTTLGVSVAASESNQSGGTFGGGNTVFDFGSNEAQDGLGPVDGTQNATPTATATTPIGADTGAVPPPSGSSSWIWIIAAIGVVLLFFFRKKL